ncbi:MULTISPECIES: hypothetical protein [Escherichia]|uniref:hypothetical protein n=2 Tax=Enterobacteriaceae TaxID=543 RepID=UPI0003349202|nr:MULTISPECIES: hypothetical protein [Escherichia]EFE0633330.1 hypothetical protein [Escherichia coli]EFN7661648.1 hypothetical protein [Escherichia coli]EOU48125.1 hypothetical protein WC5_00495 [Escherichia sp. KTE114]MBY7511659.1 hypothetical protein [Escherichia ruysiae]PSZ20166.1 hypothetical protein C7B04_02380 [Escherichia sp. 4726-5]
MSWERQKSTVSPMPEEPPLLLWLVIGLVALITGVLLFVLHVNGLAGPLQQFNLWCVAACPLVVWVMFICLRGWRYNSLCEKHQFERDEAEYAQQQWTAWAGRNIAVLHSTVIFPDALTSRLFMQAPAELELHTFQARRLSLPEGSDLFSVFLTGVNHALVRVPIDLPFSVTLLTDSSEDEDALRAAFASAWQQYIVPPRPTSVLHILHSKSFLWLVERLQSPTADIDLILVQQAEGQDKYSDVLASLLLTSDDVATKYQLHHGACLLRPMSLDIVKAKNELDIFFSTQTQACATKSIVGDKAVWGGLFATLLDCAKAYGDIWKVEQTHWLEKYAGICGPFSPWVMAAVVSDIVNMQHVDSLMLSSEGEQSFINTVTTGNQMK